jgi:hypothetical protein
MPRSYRYTHLDVFTDRLFGGNQLAVFLDGRGLSGATMQAIAKEMNYSETTFVLPPERPETDARVRIFTPAEELPVAGHPTIGTTFALARAGIVGPDRDRLVLGLGIGPTPVSLEWRNGELRFVWMTQIAPTFGQPIGDPSGAAAALCLAGGGRLRHRSAGSDRGVRRPVSVRAACHQKRRGQRGAQRDGLRRVQAYGRARRDADLPLFDRVGTRQRDGVQSHVCAWFRHRGGSGDRFRERPARMLSRPSQGRAA